MKILLATFWEIPHVGGVWNYMVQLKGQLELFGNEVDLLGFGKDYQFVHVVNQNRVIERDLFTKQVEQAFPTTVIDYVVHYYEEHMYVYELAAKTLILDQYDVIHSQDVFSTIVLNRIRPKKAALVSTLHGCVAHEIKGAYYKGINQKSIRGATYFNQIEFSGATDSDITIVANEWMKNILVKEYTVPETKLRVHHYGYDIDTFSKRMEEVSEIRRPIDKKIIIYTGRLSEMKGVHHLIGALNRLKQRTDWECWIVGDGPNKESLQLQAKKLGLNKNIFFFGKREDVPYILSLSDMLVLPTLIDNQPLSVIEAQIAGKAVIASNVGGIPEMIEHGMTGVLTPPGDEEMLALNINYLLDHEAYLINLGQRAKEWAINHWSLHEAVEKIVNIYHEAIAKRNVEK